MIKVNYNLISQMLQLIEKKYNKKNAFQMTIKNNTTNYNVKKNNDI